MRSPNVFNMPSGTAFLPALARGLKDIFGDRLEEALILLPTRRAVRALGETFAAQSGAAILPNMRPLADINPDEPPFELGELSGMVKPSIDNMQRRFEIAKLLLYYQNKISTVPMDMAAALAMSEPLISILDDADMEEIDSLKITNLDEIRNFSAEHYQNSIAIYKVIQDYWPKRLAELNLMGPMARRVSLLKALRSVWDKNPPKYPVIIAGSTGTLKATAELIKCVSYLDEGLVVLPGLQNLEDKSWENIGLQHPQYSLKKLTQIIGVNPKEIKTWPYIEKNDGLAARRIIISEALIPVQETGDWPGRIAAIRKTEPAGRKTFEEAIKKLSILEAENDEEEASCIALILRETLENPKQTASLVTPDTALARRVKSKLRRWDVDLDSSLGEPLEETEIGSWVSSLLTIITDPYHPVALATFFKHRLSTLGEPVGKVFDEWCTSERKIRGRRIDKNIYNISCVQTLHEYILPLINIDKSAANVWAITLAQVLENISSTPENHGDQRLWVGEPGEKLSSIIQSLISYGEIISELNAKEFSKLLSQLMRDQVVRPRYGTHPRLSILGPLEARLLSADRIILGGLNEGVWPPKSKSDPFLSRGMRGAIGLSLPERRFGLAAHDFSELATSPEVIITRSITSEGTPYVASRWLWRLQALMKGALGERSTELLYTSNHYLEWSRGLDAVSLDEYNDSQISKPTPSPELIKRWPNKRKLSVTSVKTMIRDPYSIYAKYILNLASLDPLDMDIGSREYGTAMHKGLEIFFERHREKLPKNAENQLSDELNKAQIEAGFNDNEVYKNKIRTKKIAKNIVDWMRRKFNDGWSIDATEINAELYLNKFDFTLTAQADLIMKSKDGYAIIDYKTGIPPSPKEVEAGFDPQLPLSGYLLNKGVFEGIGTATVTELNYVRVKAKLDANSIETKLGSGNSSITVDKMIADGAHNLEQLIIEFDKKETIYYCQPRVKYTYDYSDYDHLARREEWMRSGSNVDG